MFLNSPIRSYCPIGDWKNVPIFENGELLVSLNDFAPEFIRVESKYFLQNIYGSLEDCFCREGVATLLSEAAKNIPKGYKFLIWDAWRPVSVQLSLFDGYKKNIRKENKSLSDKELIKLTEKYVSLPSEDVKKPSPHLTGGSVDLTIIDSNGIPLQMGTEFDYFGIEAQTNFYETKTVLLDFEKVYLYNRRLLYNVLTSVGFTNYSDEWWHFDYGNQFWGVVSQVNAFYSLTSKR